MRADMFVRRKHEGKHDCDKNVCERMFLRGSHEGTFFRTMFVRGKVVGEI